MSDSCIRDRHRFCKKRFSVNKVSVIRKHPLCIPCFKWKTWRTFIIYIVAHWDKYPSDFLIFFWVAMHNYSIQFWQNTLPNAHFSNLVGELTWALNFDAFVASWTLSQITVKNKDKYEKLFTRTEQAINDNSWGSLPNAIMRRRRIHDQGLGIEKKNNN